MEIPVPVYVYLIPLLIIWGVYLWRGAWKQQHATGVREESIRLGLTEPPSRYPGVDPMRCVGCASCASACVQGALGVIRGKSTLINPTGCMGLGLCKDACPTGAIELVFGTERRGVDVPRVGDDYETNVPGIFIAGELGGMALIRNAVMQGIRAIKAVSKWPGIGEDERLDVVIIGAGPSGLAASLKAKQLKLNYLTIEQESLGGTVFHYPRGKVVMTEPVELPLVGKVKFKETTKEKLLDFWRKVEASTGLNIRYRERMEHIAVIDGGFEITTARTTYRSRTVLLALGRRGTPRKLGVPGEDLPKVVYRLVDSEQYRGQHVLVVGGGDSALEAAASLVEEAGTTVTLSYRGDAFGRAKPKNRQRASELEATGRLRMLMASNVEEITPEDVSLMQADKPIKIPNDGVIVSAGGILPTPFLRKIGIQVETKFGTR